MSSTTLRRGTRQCAWCSGKLNFRTRGDAQRFLRDAPTRDPTFDPAMMVAYKCLFAAGWHIGHSRNGRPFEDRSHENQ